MIEAVLCDYLGVPNIEGKRILDLGCGSGRIAGYFSTANDVLAADVVDQLTTPEKRSFRFTLIDSATLPFEEASFDIVLYNHVFYCTADKLGQLKEIRRVLGRDGICYFASVNRYFPIEGFTNLPLIHYLPGGLFRWIYKRIRKTGDDLYPAGYRKIIGLIEQAGFAFREYTAEIIHNPDKYHSEHGLPFRFPLPKWISPTVILVLAK
jgi:ubiquinone/menaquinone biosynthesis C-methylase UbiE